MTHNISYNEQTKLYSCPTTNCTTTSRYKHNIIKHLKSCYIVNKNKKAASKDKICSICSKSFLKKSNRDRHINTVHARDSDVVPSLIDDNIEDDDLPSMTLDGTELPTPEDTTFMETESLAPSNSLHEDVDTVSFSQEYHPNTSVTSLPIETTTTVISPPGSPLASPASDRTGNLTSPVYSQRISPEFSSKASRLETGIKKISTHLDYSNTVSNCVIKYLKNNSRRTKERH